MLNRNVNVTFDDGTYSATYTCTSVRFGMELLGKVKEDIDLELHERFQDARLLIEIKVRLSVAESLFTASFLESTSKNLIIDGVTIPVVIGGKQTWFDLFEDSNVAAFPTLKFKKKTKGLPEWVFTIGSTHKGVTS